MTGRRRRLLGCLVLVLAAALPGPVPAAAATTVATITITQLEPKAPRPGSRLIVRGTVRNTGDQPLSAVRIRLRASAIPVGSRSELAAQASRPDEEVGFVLAGAGTSAPLPDLAPGVAAPYQVFVAVDRLGLPGSGVYPLGLDVQAAGPLGTGTVARLRTWLPFSADPAGYRPTRIAWLWPLVSRPDRGADGTFPSDRLGGELGRTGRLGRLLAAVPAARRAGARLPLTYAVDPALLEAVQAMTGGYLVHAHGQPVRPGTGRAAAARFLAALRPLVAVDAVLALPYADPDIVALVRAGRTQDVGLAAAAPAFSQIAEQVLGVRPVPGLAWPPDGLLTRPALDALPAIGKVVLSGAALPAPADLPYTADAVASLPTVAGGTVSALLTDPTIQQLVGSDPQAPGAIRLAEQRFLAETLLITAERPAQSRSVVVAPPRAWAPAPAWAVSLLRDSGTVPWLHPVRLADLTPLPGPAVPRGPLTYPADARAAELPARVLTGPGSVAAVADQLARFRSILTNPDGSSMPALERALLRCESAAWRGRLAGQQQLLAGTATALASVYGRVRISSGGQVTLASRNGQIPVSIANNLDQAVRVQLQLSSNRAQLTARDPGIRRIEAGHQVTIDVRVRANSGGVFPVSATLLTPEGRPYAAPVRLLVHSSGYGAVAVGITVGALGVLLAAAAFRLARRVQLARRRG